MTMPTFTMRQLLEAGVHFGHHTRRWNPKMESYIFGVRNGIHIIDLEQSVPLLHRGLQALRDVVAGGGRVLFVGTKRQAQEPVAEAAKRCGQYYVNHRWLGGMLTNFKTISQSIKRLKELDERIVEPGAGLTKRELLELTRDRDKLERALGGIKEMGGLPDILFVIDTNKEAISVLEAAKLKIPVVAVLDSNSSPDGILYPIPGNDDAMRAIHLYCELVSGAVLDRLLLEGADIDAGRRHFGLQPIEHRARYQLAIEMDGAHRIVIARNRIEDAIRRGIAIEHRHDRNLELRRFQHRDRFFVGVDHEQDVGEAAHFLDAAQRAFQLVAVAGQFQQLALGQARARLDDALVEFFQPLDRLRDGLEIGQHAAEPAVIDIILAATLRRLGDRLLRLAFGANEQHPPAAGRDIANFRQGAMQQRHRLFEVDDVNAVAHAEQIGPHLGVPAPRVVAEMHAGFQKLAHGEFRDCHVIRSFSGLAAAGDHRLSATPERSAFC